MKDRKDNLVKIFQNDVRMIDNSVKAIVEVQGQNTADRRVTEKYPRRRQKIAGEIAQLNTN